MTTAQTLQYWNLSIDLCKDTDFEGAFEPLPMMCTALICEYLEVGVSELATEVLMKVKCLRHQIQHVPLLGASLDGNLITKNGKEFTDHGVEENSGMQCQSQLDKVWWELDFSQWVSPGLR